MNLHRNSQTVRTPDAIYAGTGLAVLGLALVMIFAYFGLNLPEVFAAVCSLAGIALLVGTAHEEARRRAIALSKTNGAKSNGEGVVKFE